MNARRTASLRRLAGAVCPPKIAGTRDGALWADAAMGPLKAAWRKLPAKERGQAGVRWARLALDQAFRGKRATPEPPGARPTPKTRRKVVYLKRGALRKARRALAEKRRRR